MRFYNQTIDTPLSLAHNSLQWGQSVMAQLVAQTNGAVYIKEIPGEYIDRAQLAWRVVDARWSNEDSMMTHFRAFDRKGDAVPFAVFGVNWAEAPRIGGGFLFEPFSRQQYIPVDNRFMTAQPGGYTVQVLDPDNPSEGLAFGVYKQGEQHQCLVVSFRLFEAGPGYPNDLMLEIR